jgi:hypothetical protein
MTLSQKCELNIEEWKSENMLPQGSNCPTASSPREGIDAADASAGAGLAEGTTVTAIWLACPAGMGSIGMILWACDFDCVW